MSIVCDKCDKIFKRNIDLNRHMNRKIPCDRKLECNRCFKIFDHKHHLLSHINKINKCYNKRNEMEIQEEIKNKKFWDPARHFASGKVPTLWVNSDSDGHFSVNITSRSFEITQERSYMTIHPNMDHGHSPGWRPEDVPEIYAFADQVLKGKQPLGKIIKQPSVQDGYNIELNYESEFPIIEATVYYLNEPITYRKPNEKAKHSGPGTWLKLPATIDKKSRAVQAKLPESAQTYYVNLKDSRGHAISSVLIELGQ